MKVAQLIQSQTPDNNAQAEMLREIFFKYLSSLRHKEQYLTRTFAVGASIKQRQFLSNSPDVVVEFNVDTDYDSPEELSLSNHTNRLVYYVGPQLAANKKLVNAFYWYCQVNRYMATAASSEENANTRKEFEKRAAEQFESIIVPEFEKILDTCPVISGMRVVDDVELGNKRGSERFHNAIQRHLAGIYTKAGLVDRPDMPRTTETLKKAILRPVNPGDYEGLNAELTPAEHEVDLYLNKQYGEVNVSDVTSKFSKAPYGWDTICTLYIVNELVRRHNRDYSYANNPNVDTNVVVSHLVSETNKFTLRQAAVISPELINKFTSAWKEIFGVTEAFSTTDSTQLFRLCREPENARSLAKFREAYRRIESEISSYPFSQPIHQAIDLFDNWLAERDPQKFFEAVIDKRQEGREIIDKCKEVVQFTHDQLQNYNDLRQFAASNKFNFSFVPSNYQEHVTQFLKIETDPWPIDGLRNYIKLKRELITILDEVRESMREKIREAYNAQFDYLEKVAKEQNVPLTVLPLRDNVIASRTTPDNIMVLQSNIDTDAFYQEQIAKILEYVDKEKKDKKSKVRQASLQTKTSIPLSSEEDIDRYLSGLRQQLLKLLVDHDGVMIIK